MSFSLPPVGTIEFVGRGIPKPAKFTVIPKDVIDTSVEVGAMMEQLIQGFDLPRPRVVLSVIGGTTDFKLPPTKFDQIFKRGILLAANNTSAWIVTGGLDVGVMQHVGNASKQQQHVGDVPRIGIATYKKVTQHEILVPGQEVRYIQQKANDIHSAALNAHHSHFILVDSASDSWGEEVPVRYALADYMDSNDVPGICIAINGGPGTIHTVADTVKKGRQVIIVDGTGRAADAIANLVSDTPDESVWDKITKDMNVAACKDILVAGKKFITIFNPFEDTTSDMDLVILRSILASGKQCDTFEQKVFTAVEWGNADLVAELLESDDEIESASVNREVLNTAFQKALELNLPEIVRLLVDKGANKSSIDMKALYELPEVAYLMERLLPYSQNVGTFLHKFRTVDPALNSVSFADAALQGHRNDYDTFSGGATKSKQLETAKKVLKRIHVMYLQLLTNGSTSFTDMLVWGIMVNRHDLAKEVWRNSVLPVHAALVATHLYNTLSDWFEGDDDYPECAKWFENQALKMLDSMEYDVAKKVMEFRWTELENKTALQIAEVAGAKDFMSHQFIQRYLDERLYSDARGKLVGADSFKVLTLIVFPWLHAYKRASPNTRFYHLYHLPVVKFWTTTIAYIAFLLICGAVLIQSGGQELYATEFVLWAFLLGTLIEEIRQWREDKETYFLMLSNQLDCVMLSLFLIYIVMRVIGSAVGVPGLTEASTDVLIVATIWSYIRLLYVFTFSKALGPLGFVMIRMTHDIAKWLFLFVIFMVSFQLGIMALTNQAGQNMWQGYPNGSFGGAFFTIVGDFNQAMSEMAQTNVGVIVLGLYAFIAQVVLVNLLIAMMGDTYSDVKDNSDKEWKFFRYSLVCDYCKCSAHPPPTNLIISPFYYLLTKLALIADLDYAASMVQLHEPAVETEMSEKDASSDTVTDMKVAKEKVLDNTSADNANSLESISIAVQMLIKQRESDRIFLEQSVKSLQDVIAQLQAQGR